MPKSDIELLHIGVEELRKEITIKIADLIGKIDGHRKKILVVYTRFLIEHQGKDELEAMDEHVDRCLCGLRNEIVGWKNEIAQHKLWIEKLEKLEKLQHVDVAGIRKYYL
ncbi:MAG TPA: hypothetical protein PKE45_18150 [Caldilineaceae bacterium]|nr:hypothetical protein [Caldilineaceae bacterium]